MATEASWQIRGDVMETCSCEVTCPCNFGGSPTRLPCEVVLGWRIEEGHFGGTPLDGLGVVLYARIPGEVFDGNWTVGVCLDERADPAQTAALGTIFAGQAGGWPAALAGLIGEALPPRRAPIAFEATDGGARITVPGLIEAESERVPHPLPDQPPLDTKVTGLVVPFYTGEVAVRRAKRVAASDPALGFDHAGRAALLGRFDYVGP